MIKAKFVERALPLPSGTHFGLAYFIPSLKTNKRNAAYPLKTTFKKFMVAHQQSGTLYGTATIERYAKVRHGPDGELLLDPTIQHELNHISLEDKHIVDIGCGAGPWALYAARHNAARVLGIDIQKYMLENALDALRFEPPAVRAKIAFQLGDAEKLPSLDSQFDIALSINDACNLPNTSFQQHFSEMARVLRPGGMAIITLPDSLEHVFTNGKRDIVQVKTDLQRKAEEVSTTNDHHLQAVFSEWNEVLRATFNFRDGRLILIDGQELNDGEAIWRKAPGVFLPNFAHSCNQYIDEAKVAGFDIREVFRKKVSDKTVLAAHNQKRPNETLGPTYLHHSAFAVLVLQKP